jgi:hypothetical protein
MGNPEIVLVWTPGTSPEIVPIWTPGISRGHNSLLRPLIGTRSEANLCGTVCRTPPADTGVESIPDF